MNDLIEKDKAWHIWTKILYIRGQWCCVCTAKGAFGVLFLFLLRTILLLFHFKAFFMSQQKAIRVTKYLDKTHMFLRENACMTVDSWAYLLVFIFSNGVRQRPLIFWLMGNDSIPHTSRLPLQICKSCLICPKKSQEETTVVMPLQSGH